MWFQNYFNGSDRRYPPIWVLVLVLPKVLRIHLHDLLQYHRRSNYGLTDPFVTGLGRKIQGQNSDATGG